MVLSTLRKIIRSIDIRSRQLVRTVGLTAPQLVVLKEVAGLTEVAIGKLADSISLSQATVTNIVDRLEARGLVERHRGVDDRRKVLLTITEAGKALATESPSILQEEFVQAFDDLAEWEQTQILSALQRVAAMMKAETLPSGPVVGSPALTEETLDDESA
jgi:DNA-binding MarR family transcriptional regulator